MNIVVAYYLIEVDSSARVLVSFFWLLPALPCLLSSLSLYILAILMLETKRVYKSSWRLIAIWKTLLEGAVSPTGDFKLKGKMVKVEDENPPLWFLWTITAFGEGLKPKTKPNQTKTK